MHLQGQFTKLLETNKSFRHAKILLEIGDSYVSLEKNDEA